MYVVITENDESQWEDITGEQYHFPPRYLKFLSPGTKVIYYKGKLREQVYALSRLSALPHYFGEAEIGEVKQDGSGDYYAEIKNYRQFRKPVLAKNNDEYLEQIPENRITNYWRDGVREIDSQIYNEILSLTQ